MCKSLYIECYLHDDVPAKEHLTDVVTDTSAVPETDVVPGARAGSIRNVFDLFSEQVEEDV